MDEDEFILAINPDPTKPCVLVEREKYDLLQDAITDNLLAYGPLTLVQLAELVADQLQEDFDGPVMRYCETVKLDMEVRGEIRRAPKFKFNLLPLFNN
jgi:hypothetical protein